MSKKRDNMRIIDFNTYKVDKEMTPYQRYLEDKEIAEIIEKREKEDDGTRYTMDDINKIIEERVNKEE